MWYNIIRDLFFCVIVHVEILAKLVNHKGSEPMLQGNKKMKNSKPSFLSYLLNKKHLILSTLAIGSSLITLIVS